MAVADIVSYIRANESLYSREALVMRLREGGYPDSEIREALVALGATPIAPKLASGGFLHFLGRAITYLVLIICSVILIAWVIIANIF